MQKLLPFFIQGPAAAQRSGKLLQCGGGLPGVQICRNLPDQNRAAAEILAGKAQLLQQRQIVQHRRRVLPAQLRNGGLQQHLPHGRRPGCLQPVKVDPLMGGVLVNEPHAPLLALAHDVGAQHLSGDPPGRLLPEGLHGLLLRQLPALPGNRGDKRLFRLTGRRSLCLCWASRLCWAGHRCRRPSQGAARIPEPPIAGGRRGAVRHTGRGAPLAVPGGPRRAPGLGTRLLPPLPKALGVQGLEEVLPGKHHLLHAPGDLHRASPGAQAVQHRVVDRVKDLLFPGKLHRGLGGVDVHIHRRHRQRDRQDAPGKFPLHDLVAVALLQCRRQELRLDKPAVDKEHLHGPGAPALEGHGNIALHRHLSAPALHGQQTPGKLPAQSGVDRGLQLPVAGGVERLGAVLDQLKGNVRMGHGQMLQKPRHGGSLGAVLLHEFEPRRRIVKEVPHRHGGALRRAGLLHRSRHATLQMEGRAALGALWPG